MRKLKQNIIYTIGHSTRTVSDFIKMLQSFDIQMLVDIRSFPGSRKYPHFNKESLGKTLASAGIHYLHLKNLGGRRKVLDNSKNNRWRNASFRGYADYMETPDFTNAIAELESIACRQVTAYMCSEAVWWRCHRSMVSDFLKAKGWNVCHIMAVNKVEEHSYTSPAKVIDGHVSYSDEELFDNLNN